MTLSDRELTVLELFGLPPNDLLGMLAAAEIRALRAEVGRLRECIALKPEIGRITVAGIIENSAKLRARVAALEADLADVGVGDGLRYRRLRDLKDDLWRWHDEAQANKLHSMELEVKIEKLEAERVTAKDLAEASEVIFAADGPDIEDSWGSILAEARSIAAKRAEESGK